VTIRGGRAGSGEEGGKKKVAGGIGEKRKTEPKRGASSRGGEVGNGWGWRRGGRGEEGG